MTFNLPLELKEKLMKLKEERRVSLSALYTEAIADYLSRIEKRRWEEGVEKALRDEEYIDEATERSEGGVEIYEY